MTTRAMQWVAVASACTLWLLGCRGAGQVTSGQTTQAQGAAQMGELAVCGPFVHKNLAVYLVLGPDRIKDTDFLTLPEALEQKKIVVHETENVSELAVENTGDTPVFISPGDVLRGGKQDRCLPNGGIIAARSGRVPIASFCVERGRWAKRGNEGAGTFASSGNNTFGGNNALALAARREADQGKVWAEVAKTQDKLSKSTGVNVSAADSQTSLELTLSNENVQAAAGEYVKTLAGVTAERENVIGLAVAVNGKIRSVDIYACRSLFAKLWERSLRTAAVAAVAELEKGKEFAAPAADEVTAFMASAEKGKATSRKLGADQELQVQDSDVSVRFSITRSEKGQPAANCHDSYLAH